MSAYDVFRGQLAPPKPASHSRTVQGAALAVLPVALKLFRRERPTMGDLVTVAGAAAAVYGRWNASRPLKAG
jgi:hypothetical protein